MNGAGIDGALLADLKRDEGFRARPYRDSEGLLTIGYGTLIETGITEAEAETLLASRLGDIVGELERRRPLGREVPAPVARALCNMAYNLGVPRLLGFQRMWAALAAGDYERAADEALDSKWARQVGARATRVAALIREGGRWAS